MKKVLIGLLLALLFPVMAWGANSSATISMAQVAKDGNSITIKIACVGDDATGAVPNASLSTTYVKTLSGFPYYQLGYYLYEVSVVDGDTTPDAADITITDDNSRTIYSEANVIPASGNNYGTISAAYRVIDSPLTVAVSNQATASATFTIYIVLAK